MEALATSWQEKMGIATPSVPRNNIFFSLLSLLFCFQVTLWQWVNSAETPLKVRVGTFKKGSWAGISVAFEKQRALAAYALRAKCPNLLHSESIAQKKLENVF